MTTVQNILVSGATGLIGKPLCAALKLRGHTVRTLSRSPAGDVQWNLAKGRLDRDAMDGVDVVIHLAGESVVQRWTTAAKQRIIRSRTQSAALLIEAILQQSKHPAFISASGISYYGIEREVIVDESSSMGAGFLADVTRQWEGVAQPLIEADVRTAFMRTGIVLSGQGGALAKMLTPFRLGLGGRIGNGQQQMSWISLPDLVQAYIFAVENESLCGAINAVAPMPVSNAEFTATLGKVLGRPTVFPMPAAIVKMIFGEMGEETVLSNLAVRPQRLTELGFEWQHPELESALLAVIH
ncbi:TIGR01777 family oxidoreductase [Coraliomargarita sp. SDUM461004]|uniref:TIGR01777 family oxidoreductase n=1 Tax=Thalassobacterium sedimentorum TaxID=3041258 RepID=A0ABU1AJH8_9BACT|nr:TIGR01777 family oxidoreductase [Coraliomargarita sp. SDUM461004]MDQ8193911.1 TIGR01777 family oxidoreductase [Coraliomargarita sp. SDUM461004]